MGRKKHLPAPQATAFVPNSTNPEAVIKREISTWGQIDRLNETIIYGEGDNLPLRMARLVNESPAAKACANTRARFIKGSKFSSDELMKLKIDRFGTTLWQFHTKLCDTLATFDGFSINFKYNREGKITNAFPLAFESVRLCKPDDSGYITAVKYNPFFGTAELKQDQTDTYPVFDTKAVLNQIQEKNKAYKGQVYYYGKTSPLYRFYPVPDYWSAKNWINIDGQIQEFHASNLDKGFFQTLVWYLIGDPSEPSPNPKHWREYEDNNGRKQKESTKTKGEAFTEMMNAAFAGASQAGGGIGMWSQTAETAVKFAAVPTNQNHDLFTTLQDLTTKNITIAFQVPGILANISEGVNLGSGGSEIQKAVELMQSNTKEERNLLEQFYNEVLLPNLAEPTQERVEIVNYNPVTVPVEIDDKFWEAMDAEERRDFIRQNVPGVKLKEAQVIVSPDTAVTPDGTTVTPQPAQPTQQPNEALKNLNLTEIKRVSKIAAQYTLGQLTYDQAKQILLGYGLTETDIDAWLTKPDEL